MPLVNVPLLPGSPHPEAQVSQMHAIHALSGRSDRVHEQAHVGFVKLSEQYPRQVIWANSTRASVCCGSPQRACRAACAPKQASDGPRQVSQQQVRQNRRVMAAPDQAAATRMRSSSCTMRRHSSTKLTGFNDATLSRCRTFPCHSLPHACHAMHETPAKQMCCTKGSLMPS